MICTVENGCHMAVADGLGGDQILDDQVANGCHMPMVSGMNECHMWFEEKASRNDTQPDRGSN